MSTPPRQAEPAPEPAPPAGAPDFRRWLPLIGLFVGLWALLPKYVTPPLNTAESAEFADHVVPGIVILGASLAALVRRDRESLSLVPLFAGMAIVLAGFWMVATHFPLVLQAFRDEAPWPGTIHHTASALAVFGLGLLWCAAHWGDLSAMEAASAEKSAPEGD